MILSLTDEKNSTKVTNGKKINYLLKQKLRYNGEFITWTIHVTILTYLSNSDITVYMPMKVLQIGYN